jgi:hypothetical protein
MTTLNSYATLAEYKAYKTSRGQSATTSGEDDGVIELLLKSASALVDSQTQRRFSPYIETRYFDVPDFDAYYRQLILDDDLLEVISITNGDGTTISSSEYKLLPNNYTPYYSIRLKDSSSILWQLDSSGDRIGVIAVNGVWGYHNKYSQAWLLGTTAAGALTDTTTTAYTVTSNALFSIGNLIRFDNELGYISALPTSSLTITRGENNSTAATHLTGIDISIWQVMEEARNAVCEIANHAYRRRFGETTSTSATVTAAGVVLAPKDIPITAEKFINTYRRMV